MPMTDPYRRAAGAYSRSNRSATDPRRLEGTVLLQAAQRLDELRSTWSPRRTAELEAALLHNRKLWTIFATEMADDASVLPLALRNNVASLAVFVFKRSLELAMQPAAEPIAAWWRSTAPSPPACWPRRRLPPASPPRPASICRQPEPLCQPSSACRRCPLKASPCVPRHSLLRHRRRAV